ncbi:MAG: aquaporin, partial [Acidobacteriota bacterium]
AGLGGAGILAPIAIGAVLMVMVFAGGHISGAHYNPAVTLAVFIRGKCAASDIPGYIAAQLVGTVAAALTVGALSGDQEMTVATFEVGPALIAEILFTFALVWVILNVATSKGTEGNSFYGLAIGFTVTGGAYSVGAISGAAFNPAVAVGLCVMGMSTWSFIWVYLVAQVIGAVLAAFAFKALVTE